MALNKQHFLAHDIVGDLSAGRQAILLHGILGSRKNVMSLAKKIVARFPEWKVIVPDLRNHGGSHGFEAPHDMAACGADVLGLAAHLQMTPHMIIGHSFGGKVALEFAKRFGDGALQVWVLDAPPGALDKGHDKQDEWSVKQVLDTVREIPLPILSRKDLVEQFLKRGATAQIALWMTTNLRPVEGGLVWNFDTDAISEMLRSYALSDYWPLLRATEHTRFDFVRAGKTARWSDETLNRFSKLENKGLVKLHLMAEAGHWLHTEMPDQLLQLMAATFF